MEQTQKKASKLYSPEFRERVVRLVMGHSDEDQSDMGREDNRKLHGARKIWPNSSSVRAVTGPNWGRGRPQMFIAEVINQAGPWKSTRQVEWQSVKWVDSYFNRCVLSPISYTPPAEAQTACHMQTRTLSIWPRNTDRLVFCKP